MTSKNKWVSRRGIDIDTYNKLTPLKFANVPSAMLTSAFIYRSLLENKPGKGVMSSNILKKK